MEILLAIERVIGWQLIPILSFLVIASYTDIKTYKIRNWTSGGLALFNIIYFVVIPLMSSETEIVKNSLLGGISAFLLIFILAFIANTPMGGDIKLVGATGFALGGIGSMTWLLVSAVFAGIGALYTIKKQYKLSWLETIQSPVLFKGAFEKQPMAPYFLISFNTLIITTLIIL